MTGSGPPRLARLLLRLLVPVGHREFVIGDLTETYLEIASRSGMRAARRWFWRETVAAGLTHWPRAGEYAGGAAKGSSLMDTVLQDLQFGLRLLRRSPGFTAVSVLTLGLGIGVNATVFSWINGVLLTPVPGAVDAGRLVEVSQTLEGGGAALSYPDYRDYRDATRTLSALAARDDQALHVTVGGVPERAWAELVTANFFDVLGVRMALGRAFTAQEDRARGAAAVTVISHGLWQRRFGADPDVVNRRVDINGRPFTVIGVGPAGFQGSQTGLSFDLWVPLGMQPRIVPGGDRLEHRGDRWLTAFGRLAPGVTVAQARDELDVIARHMAAAHPDLEHVRVSVTLLRESSRGAVGLLRAVFLALAVVAALVLFIACANLANLMIARGVARRREIAVRLSIGAGRARIARQLLTESLLIAVAGGALALVLARWTSGLLVLLVPPTRFPVAFNVGLDWRVFLFTGAAALIATLLFGLVPAVQALGADYTAALKEGSEAAGPSRRRVRDALVVAQVSLSLALLVAAGLSVRSMQNVQQIDPGFEPEGVLLTSVDLFPAGYDAARGRVFYRQLLDRLGSIPGVKGATLGRRVPLGSTGSSMSTAVIDGYQPTPGERVALGLNVVGPDYLKTLRIPLVLGREISRTDDHGRQLVAVISEAAARRYWSGRDPLGGRFRLGRDWVTVIGVAGDVKMRALNEAPAPFVYLPVLQFYHPGAVIHVRTTRDPLSLVQDVREAVQAVDPSLPTFAAQTLASQIGAATFRQRTAGGLLSVFGGLALALAAVGLYGVVAFLVSRRTREIGVRMAFGATRSAVFRLVLERGLKLTAIGTVIGLPAAVVLAQALSSILFGVNVYDPVTLLGATALLIATATAACLVPAVRATRLDPVEALRDQ